MAVMGTSLSGKHANGRKYDYPGTVDPYCHHLFLCCVYPPAGRTVGMAGWRSKGVFAGCVQRARSQSFPAE